VKSFSAFLEEKMGVAGRMIVCLAIDTIIIGVWLVLAVIIRAFSEFALDQGVSEEAVAEGVDVGHSRRLWRQVRERVAKHFTAWEEEELSG
jgi:hypothetical protein